MPVADHVHGGYWPLAGDLYQVPGTAGQAVRQLRSVAVETVLDGGKSLQNCVQESHAAMGRRPWVGRNVSGVRSDAAARNALVLWLHVTADTFQHGAVTRGSTTFPAHMVRSWRKRRSG